MKKLLLTILFLLSSINISNAEIGHNDNIEAVNIEIYVSSIKDSR